MIEEPIWLELRLEIKKIRNWYARASWCMDQFGSSEISVELEPSELNEPNDWEP